MGVIQCDNAEIAMEVLARVGPMLSVLYTEASPPGEIVTSGATSARNCRRRLCLRCISGPQDK